MNSLENAKKEYDNIPIPEELSERVNEEISRHTPVKEKKKSKISWIKWPAGAVAAAFLVFVIGLNTSESFVHAMESVPGIGTLAEVFTFRSYQVATDDYTISVEIPSVDMIADDLDAAEETVNQTLYEICEDFANEAMDDATEYRDAFISTGGTLDEWKDHDVRIAVSYQVLTQTDQYLTILITRTENWNDAGNQEKTVSIDLTTGELIETADVLDETGDTYYEDNFAVPSEDVESFAKQIQAAVSAKDLDALSDLCSFPMYVGLGDGEVIESADDLTALGAEQIFTDAIVDAAENYEADGLEASNVGFILYHDDASVNITFGVVNGKLAITGINY